MNRQGTPDSGDRLGALPVRARLYVCGLIAIALVTVPVEALIGWAPLPDGWLVVVLAALGAGAGAFEILAPGRYNLQPNFAFLFWAALVLPPWGIAVVSVACFLPGMLARATPAYKVAFNVANYFLTGMIVSALVAAAGGIARPEDIGALELAAILGGAAVGAFANHAMIVVAIALAGEQPLRGTLHQFADGTPLSFGVGLNGAVLALLWQAKPALVLVAVGSLGLMYRALWVPMLRHQAVTDPKTGLFNYEHFKEEFELQLRDARRRGRRLAVVMVDLDHLRTINNRLGHLAGDRAIRAVADALGAAAAKHGVAARFGGEEFCLLLPGFSLTAANAVMEEVRRDVRAVEFRETDAPDLEVTFSAGIAGYPEHGSGTAELLRVADEALYEAKAAGRDRVRVALSGSARTALGVTAETGGAVPAAAEHEAAPAILQSPTAGGSTHLLGRVAAALTPRRGAARRTAGDERELEQANRRLSGLLEDNRELLERMQSSYMAAIASLARTVDAKHPYRGNHADRLARITVMLGEELGFAHAELSALELGAVLHDIGEVAVADAILLKEGPLDPAELEQMRLHPEIASALVADLELPSTVKHMIRGHHERYDGTGYPDGLAGEEIPLAARLLAVADALDAMLSDRPYRKALPVAAAHAEIRAGAGMQFCPRVVDALTRCLAREPGRVLTPSGPQSTRTNV